MNLKRQFFRCVENARGWKTRQRIVVFESDDWGAIRMPSKDVYNLCLKHGYPVDKNPFERYDSLASDFDLNILFNVLQEFKDSVGNHPVITANVCVANPDFAKIEANDFHSYFFEPITDTFKRYPCHQRAWDLWGQGRALKVFFPQFHAREHINVPLFMRRLQEGNEDIKFGFSNRIAGIIDRNGTNPQNPYVQASYFRTLEEKAIVQNSFVEGLKIFEQLFGFSSQSFIPTNYIWSSDFNKAMKEGGVQFIQGRRRMLEPDLKGGKRINITYSGQRNAMDQINLVRNCQFEPALYENSDEVGNCLKEMSIAFRFNNPAIVSTHRLNFVGFIEEKNREKNIALFRRLLAEILKRWPDVVFMNSAGLGQLMEGNI